MRRAVLADRDRVVAEDPDGVELHQRREPDRRAHVVGEDEERRAERLDDPAVQREAVDRGAHAVLAHAPGDVAAGVLGRERLVALELGEGRVDEVGGAADHRRHERARTTASPAPAALRVEILPVLGVEDLERVGEAGLRLAGPRVVPLGGELGVRGRPGVEARLPLGLRRGAALDAPGRASARRRRPGSGTARRDPSRAPPSSRAPSRRASGRECALRVPARGEPKPITVLRRDQRRPLLLGHAGAQRGLDRLEVVAVLDRQRVPAVGLEALRRRPRVENERLGRARRS